MDNFDIPFLTELDEPMVINNVPDSLYKLLRDLCDRIDTLGDQQIAMYSNDPNEYAFFAVDAYDPDKAVSISYHYIDGEGTYIPFFGFYLETKSGMIVRNKEDKIILGDLVSYLRHTYNDFDYNLFVARLEKYYLGEIDTVKELFSMDTSSVQADESKSYLYNLLAFEGNESTERVRKTHTMNIQDVLRFMNVCYKYNHMTSFLYEQMLTYIKGINYFVGDVIKSHPMVVDLYNDSDVELSVREFYSKLDLTITNANQPVVADLEKKLMQNVETAFNHEYPEHDKKISKSEKNFFRMLPLIEASHDDELKCFASLLGEKQEIIDSIKSSNFKDVIKGAFLKGVITKKDNILKTLFEKSPRTIRPMAIQTLKGLAKDFRVACKYLLDITTKICKPRL